MKNRAKGINGERELAQLWADAGYIVRGLEAGGDHLVFHPAVPGVVLAQESKRGERLKLPEWIRQTEGDAPAGTVPVLSFRQNREPWRSVLRTADLVALIAGRETPSMSAATIVRPYVGA